MQNYDSSLIVRLKINKTCLLALFILVLAISPLMAIDEAGAEVITFSDYPLGTTITNQYQNLGVIFSGEGQPPIISPPEYFEITDPALMGASGVHNWGSDPVIVTFVDPTDGTPVEAINVGFNYYVLSRGPFASFMVTYYDINGGIISQTDLWKDPNPHIPPKLHKIFFDTWNPMGSYSYFWLDNLSFQTLPPPPSLVDPGPSTECEAKAGDPINLTTGDVWNYKTDYSVPGLAGGLSIKRTWNSLWNQSNPPFEAGMFGRGWTSDFEERSDPGILGYSRHLLDVPVVHTM